MALSVLPISAANNSKKRRGSRRRLPAPPQKAGWHWYRFLHYRAIRQRCCRHRETPCSAKPSRSASDISKEETVSSLFLDPLTPSIRIGHPVLQTSTIRLCPAKITQDRSDELIATWKKPAERGRIQKLDYIRKNRALKVWRRPGAA